MPRPRVCRILSPRLASSSRYLGLQAWLALSVSSRLRETLLAVPCARSGDLCRALMVMSTAWLWRRVMQWMVSRVRLCHCFFRDLQSRWPETWPGMNELESIHPGTRSFCTLLNTVPASAAGLDPRYLPPQNARQEKKREKKAQVVGSPRTIHLLSSCLERSPTPPNCSLAGRRGSVCGRAPDGLAKR